MIKFGETPGCKACLGKGSKHTDACRKRFAELLKKEREELAARKTSRNHDKQLHRLICYVDSSKTHRLVGTIRDDPCELHLAPYVDAMLSQHLGGI